jgi:hypothetical protein
MVDLRIDIDLGDAPAVLRRAAAPNLGPGHERANRHLLRVAQVYPSPPAGSTYRRTGDLKRGWEPIGPVTTAGRGAYAGVVNEVGYADYVMGDRQAVVHQGRWRTTDQIAAAEEQAVVDIIEADLGRRIGGT